MKDFTLTSELTKTISLHSSSSESYDLTQPTNNGEDIAKVFDLSRAHAQLLTALSQLRTELIDMAYDLEKCPYLDAADLACVLAHRLEKLVADRDVGNPRERLDPEVEPTLFRSR